MKYVVLSVAVLTGTLLFSFKPAKEDAAPATKSAVKWYTWEEAEKLSRTAPKKIFIDVYTDWCGWCKKMDANTFQNPVIAEYLNEHYYAVKLDAERKDTMIVGGKTYAYIPPPEGRRHGYHELAAALLNGRLSYPSIVILNEQYNMLLPMAGYRTPHDMEPILAYYAGDHNKSTNWENFQQNFKSALPPPPPPPPGN